MKPDTHFPKPVYLHQVTGTVVEIIPASKAIIVFKYNGYEQRALLWANRLIVLGKPPVTQNDFIGNFLQLGSNIKFQCHTFDPNGQDACGWFVLVAMRQDKTDRRMNDTFHFGIVSGQGMFTKLFARQGIMDYTDNNGESCNVLCQASKVRLYGKRLNNKQKMNAVMQLDNYYQFDAVPTIKQENDSDCAWYATTVWRGNRTEDVKKRVAAEQEDVCLPILTEIKNISTIARGVFWQGYGHVWSVVNDEYVLLLGRIKPNYYEVILAHRSCLTLSGIRAGTVPLTTLFVQGDKIQFVAVPAPLKLTVQWVATHISPDSTGHLRKDINTMS